MEQRISVRNLVEFVLRSGSINIHMGDVGDLTEGSSIHRMIQQEVKDAYKAEYFLSHTVEQEEFALTVEGRADGFAEDGDCVHILECKSTVVRWEDIREDSYPQYWAQAQCYGALACLERGFTEAEIKLIYFHKGDKSRTTYTRRFTSAVICDFFFGLLEKYFPWCRLEAESRERLKATAAAVGFPYASYRKGQREMAAAIYRGILREQIILCQAPTGLGKTLSSMFPAVKALGEGRIEKIFYLTAKTTTATAGCQALNQLRVKGLMIRSIHLTSKQKLCPMEEVVCIPEHCPYANGHYDRVNNAAYALLSNYDHMDTEDVLKIAEAFSVCPYELQLDASMFCACILCDYNYLFDPVARLQRYFSMGHRSYAFLVDEAHNLVSRSREMYTKSLDKKAFLALKKELKGERKLVSAVQAVNKAFLAIKKEDEETFRVSKKRDGNFASTVDAFCEAARRWMDKNSRHHAYRQVLNLFLEARAYLIVDQLYCEGHVTITEINGSQVTRTIHCLDASPILADIWKIGHSAALFSATMEPLPYYENVLGCKENGRHYAFLSPFDRDKLGLAVFTGASTLYKDRTNSAPAVTEAVYGLIAAKKGNYMVYFPSFAYLRLIHAEFVLQHPDVTTLCQKPDAGDVERASFLAAFEERERLKVGFCVLGGSFGEGVDLPGDRLIGCAVVGVGLPQVNTLQELLRQYYQEKNGCGFDYAYRYPGMNKVQQAAGRVIRTERDVGTVLLIDNRFAQHGYSELLPSHWSHRALLTKAEQIEPFFREFWRKSKE